MHNLTKTNEYSVMLMSIPNFMQIIRVLFILVQKHAAMADDSYVVATACQCLAVLFNAFFSVHIPVLNGSIEI